MSFSSNLHGSRCPVSEWDWSRDQRECPNPEPASPLTSHEIKALVLEKILKDGVQAVHENFDFMPGSKHSEGLVEAMVEGDWDRAAKIFVTLAKIYFAEQAAIAEEEIEENLSNGRF